MTRNFLHIELQIEKIIILDPAIAHNLLLAQLNSAHTPVLDYRWLLNDQESVITEPNDCLALSQKPCPDSILPKSCRVIQAPNTNISHQQFKQFLRILKLSKSFKAYTVPIVDQANNVINVVILPQVEQSPGSSLKQSTNPAVVLIMSGKDHPLIGRDNPSSLLLQLPDRTMLTTSHQVMSSDRSSDLNGNSFFEERIAQKIAESRYLRRTLEQKDQAFDTLEKQARWLINSHHCLAEISQRIQNSRSLQDSFSLIVREAKTLFDSDRVCIYQYQHSDMGGFVIAEATTETVLSTLGYVIRNEVVSSPAWIERYQQRGICNITDTAAGTLRKEPPRSPLHPSSNQTHEYSSQLWQFFQIQAKLAVPIFYNGTLWGLLALHQCRGPREWTAAEIDVLKVLAHQICSKIEQFDLTQTVQHLQAKLEAQRQEHSARLAQTINFEAMLKRITDRVRNSLDEDQILQTAVQELADVLEAQHTQSVSCNTSEAGRCNVVHEYTLHTLNPLASEEALASFADLCCQLQRGESSQFCPVTPLLNRGKQAILVCPVFDGQGCLGSLRLYRQRSHYFSEQEVQLVQQVASHCAIAIRQARLYQASQMQVQELEHLNQLKDDFLSTVSHELRTPLSSIKMVTNLLKLAMDRAIQSEAPMFTDVQKQKVAQYIKVLEDECEREINLINDLLATQYLNTGIHPISPTTITLQEWIPQITSIFQHRTHMNQQFLDFAIPADLPPIVSDSFMLSRVIVELLNNACKYTPPGGQISLQANANANTIQLSVYNTGTHIDSEQLLRIFDPFYRIPNGDRWKQGGTGLGLSLVKKFVEYLGGTIEVDNAVDSVQFRVNLPKTPLV